MSMPEDYADCELRDENGNPRLYRSRDRSPVTRPRAGSWAPNSGSIEIDQRQDNRQDRSRGKRVDINKALNWFAALFAGLSFGGLIIAAILLPTILDGRDRALRAEIGQRITAQDERLRTANENAKIASEIATAVEAELKVRNR